MNTKIGHYDIVTELGRGGMGVVYKGHETALNRYVAIKMLAPALAHDESIKERFLREARSMAALNDPHIIQVYFIGEDNGQPFFAMEFVEGESLSTYLKRAGHMTTEQVARVIYQTAQGLAAAHDKGVVHRDIKPGNLMLNGRGHIKIADFGIAMSSTDFSKKLTSTGEFVGTPGYLSPEVCTGQPVDMRSDIFSLGIVMFELLTGRMPFTDESPLGLLLEVVRAEIPDVSQINRDVDPELVRVLKRMTAKNPDERYQDCHELAADLAHHPLVSGSQTVSAKPILSTAASTMLGMKTPLPQARPAVAPTPPPMSPSVAQQAQARDATPTSAPILAPPPPRASVLQREERKSSGMLWPIAAVLLLGATGVGAWAMRDRIPLLQQLTGTLPPTQLTDSGNSSATASTTTATSAVPSTTTPVAAATAPTMPAAPPPIEAIAAATDPVAPPVAPGIEPSAPSTSEPTVAIAAADPESTTHTGIAGAPGDVGQPSADAEALGPLRRMAAARKAELASTNPRDRIAAPPPPERIGPPKIAVVAIGDPALTGPAKQVVEEALSNQGFLLVDTDLIPGVGGGDLVRIMGALQRSGVRAVVAVRAEPLGTTQLNYYGQSDTLYSANLTVRSYDVAGRSPLSAGVRAKVDFTALNAESKAQEAIEPQVGRLIGSLAAYRPKGHGG